MYKYAEVLRILQAHMKDQKKITQHLYEQSNHPHIKNGEVYVTYLTNVNIDNNVVDAIGIFKADCKLTLQFEEKRNTFRNDIATTSAN
jgi:hypothetical protein